MPGLDFNPATRVRMEPEKDDSKSEAGKRPVALDKDTVVHDVVQRRPQHATYSLHGGWPNVPLIRPHRSACSQFLIPGPDRGERFCDVSGM